MTFLCRLASHLLIDLAVVTGLCSVLYAMIQNILGATDEETIEVLSQRLAWNDIESRFTGHLLQVDEAIACMYQADVKLITDEQKEAEDQRATREVFVRDYCVRRRRIDDSKLVAPKGKAKAKARSKLDKHKFGKGSIPQADAKQYLPPGASIWKDRVHGGWCCHMPPRARISEPYGSCEASALVEILRRVWAQSLELRALDWVACPYLFDR